MRYQISDLTKKQKAGNRNKSKIRYLTEYMFGFKEQSMYGLLSGQ